MAVKQINEKRQNNFTNEKQVEFEVFYWRYLRLDFFFVYSKAR